MIEAQFGAQHNRAAPVSRHVQRIFGVLRGESRALTLPVIEKVRSEPHHELGIDFAIYVIDHCEFWRRAAQLPGVAKCAICANFGRDRICHVAESLYIPLRNR